MGGLCHGVVAWLLADELHGLAVLTDDVQAALHLSAALAVEAVDGAGSSSGRLQGGNACRHLGTVVSQPEVVELEPSLTIVLGLAQVADAVGAESDDGNA